MKIIPISSQFTSASTSMTGAVLIVENESLVRDAMVDILEADGYTVMATGNGYDGIAAYEARLDEIELVILDMRLPGIGGPETLQALRRINQAVKVLVASAYDEQEIRQAFNDDQKLSILKKPFGADTLVSSVRKALAT